MARLAPVRGELHRSLGLAGHERNHLRAAPGPPDPQRSGLARTPQDLLGAVLGPVSRARLDLPHGSLPVAVAQSQMRADARGVAGRPNQPDDEAGGGSLVSEQPRGGPVLTDSEVEPPVAVEVGVRRPPLLAVHNEAGPLPWHRLESAGSIAEEQQTPARIVSRRADFRGKEILAQKKILLAVPVEVGQAGVEGRCELSGERK